MQSRVISIVEDHIKITSLKLLALRSYCLYMQDVGLGLHQNNKYH